MVPIIPRETVDDNRQLILDAAEERYKTYGYGKTTMAEIADDAGMSAANLYRYFKNKDEIGCACAQRCMGRRIDHLRDVTRRSGLTASERLRSYVLESLAYNHEDAGSEDKLNELVQRVIADRKDLIYSKIEAELGLIAEILAQGNNSGEFAIEDIIVTARNIQTAIVLFDTPVFMGLYSLEQFDVMANGVVDLILSGIEAR